MRYRSLLLLIFFGSCILPETMAGQEPSHTDRAVLTGRVVDQMGEPISNAKLVLGSPVSWGGQMQRFTILRPVYQIETTSDESGQYSIGFDRNDVRFLQPGNLKLLVQHEGFALNARQFPLYRMTVDLPLEITLQPCAGARIQIVDGNNDPVDNIGVAIARTDGVELPVDFARESTSITDSNGWVTLPLANKDNLQAVYLFSDNRGNQRISVHSRGDQLEATMIKTTSARLRLEMPGDADPALASNLNIIIPSMVDSNIGQGKYSDYSWHRGATDKNGQLDLAVIGLGLASVVIEYPDDFPFRLSTNDNKQLSIGDTISENQFTTKLKHSISVRGKVVEIKTKNPVKSAFIRRYGQLKKVFTDDTGAFEFQLARDDTVDIFSLPAFEDLVNGISSYRRITALPNLEMAPVKTMEMIRIPTFFGTVIDVNGTPVPGAIIRCTRTLRGNSYDIELMSDRNGLFAFRSCQLNEQVDLRATSEFLATQEKTIYKIDPASPPTLVVVPQRRLAFTGSISDPSGSAISDASVKIVKSVISSSEGFSSKSVLRVPLFENEIIRSSVDGIFASPETTEQLKEFWIEIKSDGYRDFISRPLQLESESVVISSSDEGQERATVELGSIELSPLPSSVETQFIVVDPAGQPVDSARVVFVTGREDKVAATTATDGSIQLSVIDRRQVLAIARQGFRHHFQIVDSPGDLKQIVLHPSDSGLPIQEHTRAADQFSIAEIRQLATRLLAKTEIPSPASATYHRMYLYSHCLAVANLQKLLELLENPELEWRDDLFQGLLEIIATIEPDNLSQVASTISDPGQRLVFWLAVSKSSNPQDVELALSEALIASREFGGITRAHYVGYVTNELIKNGKISAARTVISEVWESTSELKDILNSDEPSRNAIGVARVFGPVMAIVDFDIATRLIEKNPQGQEQSHQKTQALFYLSESDPEEFRKQIDNFGYDNLSDEGMLQYFQKTGVPNDVDACIQALNHLPDTVAKGEAQAELSRVLLESGDDRGTSILKDALRTFGNTELTETTTDYMYHVSPKIVDMLKQSVELAPEVKDEIAFETLWNWSGTNLVSRNFGLTGSVTRGIARFDSDIARAILEPCFEDFSWVHDGVHGHYIFGASFLRSETLAAAARIDPAWAVEICSQLIEGPYRDDPLRQLELIHSVCNSFQELIAERLKE